MFLNEIQELNQLFSNVLSDGYKDFFADQFLALSQSKKIFWSIVQRSSQSSSVARVKPNFYIRAFPGVLGNGIQSLIFSIPVM